MSSLLQNEACPHFFVSPFFLGQKHRFFDPYSLSLSSIVAAAIRQILFQFYIFQGAFFQEVDRKVESW